MPGECAHPDCESEATGFDLEASEDDNNDPIWIVAYECEEGHTFLMEFDRVEDPT